MKFKSIKELEKGCGRGMQSGRTFCGNKHKKKDYVLLCSKCLALLTQTKDIVKIINEGWEKHLDKYMNRLKHTCNLCKFVEELLARIKGEEK